MFVLCILAEAYVFIVAAGNAFIRTLLVFAISYAWRNE